MLPLLIILPFPCVVSGMYLGTVIPYDAQMVWKKGMFKIAHNYFNNISDMGQICESDKKLYF